MRSWFLILMASPVAALAMQASEQPVKAMDRSPPRRAVLLAPTTGQLVTARQAGMHMAATLLFKNVGAAIKSKSDVKDQFHEAEGIVRWAAAIPGLFPLGSSSADSRAKPEIWRNKADFDRKAADLGTAATRLLTAANAGDAADFALQAKAVEQKCAACHTTYRAK